MKLQFVSDLHLEMRDLEPYESIIKPQANILALLGDIGIPSPTLEKFLKWCSSNFEYVFYVPGNHEYYNPSGISIDEINKQLQEICDRSKVIFMNNHVCVIGKIAFIGSILWSFIPPETYSIIQNNLNDFKYIFSAPHTPLTPSYVSNEFIRNMDFISDNMKYMKKEKKKIIVLTHHIPQMDHTSHPKYNNLPTNHAFATDIRIEPNIVKYWLAGHSHYNFHIKNPQFELISNQWGYSNIPEDSYDPNLVLDL